VSELFEPLTNPPHLHLLLNHVPTFCFAVGLAIAAAAQFYKNEILKRTSLVLFFCVAVVSIATYITGNAAQTALRGTEIGAAYPAYISPGGIRAHEDAALLAFVWMEITGFFAWVALWQGRRAARYANGFFVTVLILSVVTFGLMARAAELGGAIHHPEIESAAAAPAPPADGTNGESDAGWTRNFGTMFVSGSTWVWPTLETLHFIGLCMLFTAVLIIDLRVLGFIRGASYTAVYQLLPIGMLGFGINLVTGMMFFIGSPVQYALSATFYWKIVFVVLGGLNILYFLLDDGIWNVKADDDAPLGSKVAAASAIFIWTAVLFCGHMLPFLGQAF
jgi:uncharacterized membrane protein